jgi:hypothetical protein
MCLKWIRGAWVSHVIKLRFLKVGFPGLYAKASEKLWGWDEWEMTDEKRLRISVSPKCHRD